MVRVKGASGAGEGYCGESLFVELRFDVGYCGAGEAFLLSLGVSGETRGSVVVPNRDCLSGLL
jgi:hypothetical protein